MTTAKHTPGPWGVAPGNFIVADFPPGKPDEGIIVGEVDCQKGNPADLLLFAAAPELLKVAEWADKAGSSVPLQLRQMARAAIAKATGEART